MTRRCVRVELNKFSATISGPRLLPALDRAGCRWMWDPYSHRAVQVHRDSADDVIAALEADGQPVEVVDRAGNPIPAGGLLGVAGGGDRP
jgi:hypothetical protein